MKCFVMPFAICSCWITKTCFAMSMLKANQQWDGGVELGRRVARGRYRKGYGSWVEGWNWVEGVERGGTQLFLTIFQDLFFQVNHGRLRR